MNTTKAPKVECPVCHKSVTTTKGGWIRQHGTYTKADHSTGHCAGSYEKGL